MVDQQPIGAKVKVKITKMEGDTVLGVEEHEVELSKEEAEQLWQSQQQA